MYNESDSDKLWFIPLTYTKKTEADFSAPVIKDWLMTKNKTLNINLETNDWIIFNIQQKGKLNIIFFKSSLLFLFSSQQFKKVFILTLKFCINILFSFVYVYFFKDSY